MSSSVELALAITIAVVSVTAAVLAGLASKAQTTPRARPVAAPLLFNPKYPWVIVGAGLAGMTCLRRLPASVRKNITFREASARVGGRALSSPQAVSGISTETSPFEFAAWVYREFTHPYTSALLQELGVASIAVTLVSPESFSWTPQNGKQPFGVLDDPTSATKDLLYAHTGIDLGNTPQVDRSMVAQLDTPISGLAPVGFGWQDVVLRGIGTVPILYNRVLQRVTPNSDGGITLSYASGFTETVGGVVLTLPPPAMLQIVNLPVRTRDLITSAFVTVPLGVLYLTWSSMDVWWQKAGYFAGTVSTSLPIGRLCITSPNAIRCSVTNVKFWTDMLVESGETETAAKAASEQLSQVFGVKVPAPASVSFKGWTDGVSLWTKTALNNRAPLKLSRPWGSNVPIWWASSDISETPGLVEGAVTSGSYVAREVSEYVSSQRQ